MTDQPTEVPADRTAPTCYRHHDRETYISCQRCGRPICPDCMRQASVGFQCPECVAEGARTTRQARTAYGGVRPGDASLTAKVLVGLNVLVWVVITATGGASSAWVDRLALLPRTVLFGFNSGQTLLVEGVADSRFGPGGAYWQLLTSAFTHVQLLHLGFNMFALWVLGPQLEQALGRARFVTLYLVSALAGSASVMWLSEPFRQTLGASGAVFGLMGALCVLAFKVHGNLAGLLPWLLINAVFSFVVPNISWQGHLGGFVAGCVVAAVFAWAPRKRRAAWQAAGASLIAVGLVAALAVRIAVLNG